MDFVVCFLRKNYKIISLFLHKTFIVERNEIQVSRDAIHSNDSKKVEDEKMVMHQKHRMRGFAVLLAVCFLNVFVSSLFASELKEGDLYTLTILYTNDIHGNVNHLPKYATIMKQVRSEAKNLLVLDAGDIFLRGEFQDYEGELEMKLRNKMGYDACVLGNNDFRIAPKGGNVERGNQLVDSLVSGTNFKTLLANVRYKDSQKTIPNTSPYMVKNINGVHVGIIGVTSMKPQVRKWEEVSDKTFEVANETVSKLMPEVQKKSDVAIVLSHAGIVVDIDIAKVKGVSAVIGADDHFILKKPMYASFSKVPITQAGGEQEHYLGRLDLIFQQKKGALELISFDGFLYDNLENVKPDSEIEKTIELFRMKQLKPAA